MGGRGRESYPRDRWDWLQDISYDRLQNYGWMSYNNAVIDGKNGYLIEDVQKTSLNYAASKEHERRTGFVPDWKKK